MSDRRSENPKLWVWDARESFRSMRAATPADLIAAVRRGVESGTIKGSDLVEVLRESGVAIEREDHFVSWGKRFLVIPVSDGGSE